MQDVDTRISPSLHPENVRSIQGFGDDVAPVLASTRAALASVYSGLVAVHNARDSARTNPTWNQAQQIIETDAFATKQMQMATKSFDKALAGLRQGIAELERDLSAPITSNAATPIAQEIRAHVKAMKTGDRLSFIEQAIASGDDVTATAVLGTVPYLSGFDAKMHAVYVRMYHERIAPEKARHLTVMQGAAELLMDRSRLFFPELEKAIGASTSKVKLLREAKTKAEQAFVMHDAA